MNINLLFWINDCFLYPESLFWIDDCFLYPEYTLFYTVYPKITSLLSNRKIQVGFSRNWNRSFWAFLAGAGAGAAEQELVFSQFHGAGAVAEIIFYQKSWIELMTEI